MKGGIKLFIYLSSRKQISIFPLTANILTSLSMINVTYAMMPNNALQRRASIISCFIFKMYVTAFAIKQWHCTNVKYTVECTTPDLNADVLKMYH